MVHILKKVGTPDERNIVPFQPSILVYKYYLPSNIVKNLVELSLPPLSVSPDVTSLFVGWSCSR